jgi:hypothetical protein
VKRIVFILFIIVLAVQAKAQYSYTGTATGSITIDSMYVITAGAGTSFTFGGVEDYANGVEKLNYAGISIKCNYNWKISVRATTANFTAGGGGSANMPCSILTVRKSGNSYLTISTTSQQLAVGNRGPTSTSGNTFNVDIKSNPGYSYNGGTYSIVLQYTVTKQ